MIGGDYVGFFLLNLRSVGIVVWVWDCGVVVGGVVCELRWVCVFGSFDFEKECFSY